MNRWLFKTEPTTYSFQKLLKDGKTLWDGVKNPLALKHLASIRKGDPILIYHTGSDRQIVGLARAASNPFADPRKKNPKLLVIELEPDRALKSPLPLSLIKADSRFKNFDLVRIGRLSIMPVPDSLWSALLRADGGQAPV